MTTLTTEENSISLQKEKEDTDLTSGECPSLNQFLYFISHHT